MFVRSLPVRALAALAIGALVTACESDSDGTDDRAARTVVVGSAPSSESLIVAHMYAGALQAEGYRVELRERLGPREIYLPALEEGGRANGVDLVPEYVAPMLEFVNRNAGEAGGDLDASAARLRARLDGLGLTALEPSPATRQDAFAVTRATAERLRLRMLSDLTAVADQLTLGAAPDCRTRPLCLPGLERAYGLRFKAVRALDAGGPATLEALSSGDVDVGQVVSSDGALAERDLVVLEDDKGLLPAGNVVPAIRNDVLDDGIRSVLNEVSAALTTGDLIELNRRAGVDGVDPGALAREWLQRHGLAAK